MPPADAARKAAEEIAVGKYDFVPQDGGLQVRAPKGEGDRTAAYARHVLDTLNASDLPDMGGNMRLSPDDRRDILLSSIRRGVWVNNERDDGWMLVDVRHRPVQRADGRRVEFRFSDVKPVPVDQLGRNLPVDEIDATAVRSGLSADQVRANALRRRAAQED